MVEFVHNYPDWQILAMQTLQANLRIVRPVSANHRCTILTCWLSDINRTAEPTSSLPEPKDVTIKDIKRRLRDPSQPILLVGESETLSTTLALAAMRGSFHNIWSSSYPVEDLSPGIIDFIQLMLENIIRCSKQSLTYSITQFRLKQSRGESPASTLCYSDRWAYPYG